MSAEPVLLQVDLAIGVLQAVATLSLGWIAGVRYLFQELGTLVRRDEGLPRSRVGFLYTNILVAGVWGTGYLLTLLIFLTLFRVLRTGSSIVGQLTTVAFLVGLWATFFVVALTVFMIVNVAKDDGWRYLYLKAISVGFLSVMIGSSGVLLVIFKFTI